MPIPKHDEIRVPILEHLKDGREVPIKDFVEPMASHFNLSEEERSEVYEAGKHNKFANRVFWALSYLSMSGLLSKPRRGVYKISAQGLQILETPEKVNEFVKKAIQQRRAERNETIESDTDTTDEDEFTPEESLYESYEKIKQSIYSEILDIILRKDPKEFEGLVVKLLQKMGYGGKVKDSGFVTQYVNDKGIDGIIREDVLGLGRIHIQAKRHKPGNNISREDIQKFVGALAVAQSNKGVFITTSKFTPGAREYVEGLNATTTIVLINGEQLAEYIYEYGLGMQTEQILNIKKLDNDFWESMVDDEK